MKEEYIKSCPCWISQKFFNADINFEKPYNEDTLDYLNHLFNHGLIQKIYRIIDLDYKNPEIQEALYNFIVEAWNNELRQRQN